MSGALCEVLCSMLAGNGVRKLSSAACGFSPIKIDFSD